MRLDTRLQYAEYIPYDVRHPILLPRKHWVMKLIVKHYHEKGHHNFGTNQTLIGFAVWIMAARKEIIEWVLLLGEERLSRLWHHFQQII